ncbi:MAG: hydrolase [Deltaproteobacteria bacterium]|nr:hydrolase [Deltaproteobacteria bacterium]
MKRQGSSILFVNELRQILLFLRDDLPHIPYPNTWDVPGGHVEEDETPAQCIVREMKEEMGLDLERFELFSAKEFNDRIEHTFWKSVDLNIEEISLQEGQSLRWFSEEEAGATVLAYGFNEIVAEFYAKAPFLRR